jgi:4-hydroxy-tetrahydrodipicolinate reductase
MVDVALLGATGRMGDAILHALREAPDLRLVGALASPRSAALGRDAGELAGGPALGVAITDDPGLALRGARVAIDFSVADAAPRHVDACVERGCALVLGVTALDESCMARLRAAATRIAIVQSPNMSPGVNLCFALAARAAAALAGYDVEIVDLHHRHKRDAPSGTALRFGEIVAAARGAPAGSSAAARGGRTPGSVGYSSLRLGEIAGEHTVLFANAAERVEITHRAGGREAFAAGALAAARWAAARKPGLYGMHDVLGLEAPATR